MEVLILTISASRKKGKTDSILKSITEYTAPGCHVEEVDVLKYINLLLQKFIEDGYIIKLRNGFPIWDNPCDNPDGGEDLTDITGLFNDFVSQKFEALMDGKQPDIIVSTHPYPLKIMDTLRLKDITSVPLAALVTGLSIGYPWFSSFIDAYIILQENLRQELINKGVPEHKIFSIESDGNGRIKEVIGYIINNFKNSL